MMTGYTRDFIQARGTQTYVNEIRVKLRMIFISHVASIWSRQFQKERETLYLLNES